MPKLNFTAAALKAHFDKNPRVVLYDVQQRGLAAYMTSTGHITFFAHFRIAGSRQVKKTISRLGELSVAEARSRVAALVVAGKAGEDVLGDKRREAEAAITLGQVFELHKQSMIRRNCSPASVAVNEGTWRTRLAKYASRPLSPITKAEARNWHQQWRSAGPCAANRGIKLLSILHNFAAKKTDAELGSNPFRAVDMWQERLKRDVLDFNLLGEWWQAVNGLENPSQRAYWKLLMATSLRRADAACIRIEDIRGTLLNIRPAPKGNKPFHCPITPMLANHH